MLLLLCAVLITVVFSGRSLARYISQKDLDSGAGVAALNCAVDYKQTNYAQIAINVNESAIYMVVDEFTLQNTGEVAFDFDLSLVLSRVTGSESYDAPVAISHTSVAAPTMANGALLRQIRMKNASAAEVVDINFSDVCKGQTYTAGKIYYAVSDDGVNYTWHTANDLVLSGELLPKGKVYYKVAYFIDLSVKDDHFNIPQVSLLYRLECEQILK